MKLFKRKTRIDYDEYLALWIEVEQLGDDLIRLIEEVKELQERG